MSETIGVLLLAYGTPASLDDLEAYYTHIRRGRRPTPELLHELTLRYRAIGGRSPLLEIARAQAAGLEALLNRSAGSAFRVTLGMKHAAPFIEDGVASLTDLEVDRAVALVLAPHYSAHSVGEYIGRVQAATKQRGGPDVAFIQQWHLSPAYVALLADRVRSAVEPLAEEDRARTRVVFTAHSLPQRILETGDPYPNQVRETAAEVARLAGVADWSVAWQSAGRTPDPWIGPDVRDVVRELAAGGHTGVVVCPAGFVSDHLEVLYDLDVDCRQVAERAGLRYARTPSPNADQAFIEALAQVVTARLQATSR